MKFLVALMLAVTSAALAQQPQTPDQPLVDVNARITNGVGPGYWLTKQPTGLVMNISSGTAFCSGTIREYAGGTLTMSPSTTNYVYLNTAASCVPAVKTAVFSSSDIPIAIVGTATSSVTTVDDVRTMFFAGGGGGGGGCTPTAGGGPYPTRFGFGEVVYLTNDGTGCDSDHNLITDGNTLWMREGGNIEMDAPSPRDNDEQTLLDADHWKLQSSTGNGGTPGIHMEIDDGDASVGGGSGGGNPLFIGAFFIHNEPTANWAGIDILSGIGGADKPLRTFNDIMLESSSGGAKVRNFHGIEIQMNGAAATVEESGIHNTVNPLIVTSNYCDYLSENVDGGSVNVRAALGCGTDKHSTFGGPITTPGLNVNGTGASYISAVPIALTTCPTPLAGTDYLCADYPTRSFRISNDGNPYFTVGGGGGGGYTGCTSDGANGLVCTGQVKANNVLGMSQPQNRQTLNAMQKCTANMDPATGNSPSQCVVVINGDSTAAFHNGYVLNKLIAEFGNSGFDQGGTYNSSSGTVTVNADGTRTLVSGACETRGAGGTYSSGNVLKVYYLKEPGAGTITITSLLGAALTPTVELTASAANASTIGAVFSVNKGTAANYQIKVCSSGGNVRYTNIGIIDSTINGIVTANFGQGGLSLPDLVTSYTSNPAISGPWIAALNANMVMFEMKTNGIQLSNCDLASAAAPTVFQPYSYWWNLYVNQWITAFPYADIESTGSYSIDDADLCVPIHNKAQQEWAAANGQFFYDNYYPWPYSKNLAVGNMTVPAGVHSTIQEQIGRSNGLWTAMGFDNWITGTVWKDIINNNTNSRNFWVGPRNPNFGSTTLCPPNTVCTLPSGHLFDDPSSGSSYMDLTAGWIIRDYNAANVAWCIQTSNGLGSRCNTAKGVLDYTGQATLSNVQVFNAGTFTSTFQTAAGSALLKLKSTLGNPSGNANVGVDKGATGAVGSVQFSVGGSLIWDIGNVQDNNWDIYDRSVSRTVFRVLPGAPANSFTLDGSGNVTLLGSLTNTFAPAASQSAATYTGALLTGGTGTTNFPHWYINQGTAPTTWSTSGTLIGLNAPTGFGGNFIDFHLNGGASLFKVGASGTLTSSGSAAFSSMTLTSALNEALNTISFSATPVLSINCNTNYIILTGNVTSSTIAAGTNGQKMTIMIAQDATGSRTWTWPTNVRGGGTIGSTLSTISVQNFVYHTALAQWIATSAILTGI